MAFNRITIEENFAVKGYFDEQQLKIIENCFETKSKNANFVKELNVVSFNIIQR